MPIRLFAIDLDGTLLTEAKTISSAVREALAAAQAAGVRIILASARPPRSVRQFYQPLELDTPTINYNGAMVFDPPSNRVLLHRTLSVALVRRMIDFARRRLPQVVVSLEIGDRWLTDRFDPGFQTETSRQFAPDVLGLLDEILTEPVTKLMLLGAHEPLAALEQQIVGEFDGEMTLTRSDRDLLQINSAGTDKGMALAFLAGHFGLPLSACAAIGDAPNDAAMLGRAGMGLAMGHAHEELKRHAQHRVADNEHDGVAEAIHKYVLKK